MLTDEQVTRAFIIIHLEGECPIDSNLESKNLFIDGCDLRLKKNREVVAHHESGKTFTIAQPENLSTCERYAAALFEQMLDEYMESANNINVRNMVYSSLEPVTENYTPELTDAIADEVAEHIGKTENGQYCVADVHLAIGYVLCKRLGCLVR